LHASPSHSSASQQGDVSFHGETHIESGFQLESQDILGGSSPRSPPSFVEHYSLEPQSTVGTQSMIVSSPPASSLSDLAEKLRVTSSIDLSRGPSGSPTTNIITPPGSVGHTVYSTVVTTGILSDPGVSHPEFVSREVFDGALKAIETMF